MIDLKKLIEETNNPNKDIKDVIIDKEKQLELEEETIAKEEKKNAIEESKEMEKAELEKNSEDPELDWMLENDSDLSVNTKWIESWVDLKHWKEIFAKWVSENWNLFKKWKLEYSWKREQIVYWELVRIKEARLPWRVIESRIASRFAWKIILMWDETFYDKISDFSNLKSISYIKDEEITQTDCWRCHSSWKIRCHNCSWQWELSCSNCWWNWEVSKTFNKKETIDWGLCRVCWGSKQIACQWCWWIWTVLWNCLWCNWAWQVWWLVCNSCQWQWSVQNRCTLCNWTQHTTCNACGSNWRIIQIVNVPQRMVEKCTSCGWWWKEICSECLWDWTIHCDVCKWDKVILNAKMYTTNFRNNVQKVSLTNINLDDTQYVINKYSWKKIEEDIKIDFLRNHFNEIQIKQYKDKLSVFEQVKAKKKIKNLFLLEFIKWKFIYNWITRELFIIWDSIYLSSEPVTKWGKAVYSLLKNSFIVFNAMKILYTRLFMKK